MMDRLLKVFRLLILGSISYAQTSLGANLVDLNKDISKLTNSLSHYLHRPKESHFDFGRQVQVSPQGDALQESVDKRVIQHVEVAGCLITLKKELFVRTSSGVELDFEKSYLLEIDLGLKENAPELMQSLQVDFITFKSKQEDMSLVMVNHSQNKKIIDQLKDLHKLCVKRHEKMSDIASDIIKVQNKGGGENCKMLSSLSRYPKLRKDLFHIQNIVNDVQAKQIQHLMTLLLNKQYQNIDGLRTESKDKLLQYMKNHIQLLNLLLDNPHLINSISLTDLYNLRVRINQLEDLSIKEDVLVQLKRTLNEKDRNYFNLTSNQHYIDYLNKNSIKQDFVLNVMLNSNLNDKYIGLDELRNFLKVEKKMKTFLLLRSDSDPSQQEAAIILDQVVVRSTKVLELLKRNFKKQIDFIPPKDYLNFDRSSSELFLTSIHDDLLRLVDAIEIRSQMDEVHEKYNIHRHEKMVLQPELLENLLTQIVGKIVKKPDHILSLQLSEWVDMLSLSGFISSGGESDLDYFITKYYSEFGVQILGRLFRENAHLNQQMEQWIKNKITISEDEFFEFLKRENDILYIISRWFNQYNNNQRDATEHGIYDNAKPEILRSHFYLQPEFEKLNKYSQVRIKLLLDVFKKSFPANWEQIIEQNLKEGETGSKRDFGSFGRWTMGGTIVSEFIKYDKKIDKKYGDLGEKVESQSRDKRVEQDINHLWHINELMVKPMIAQASRSKSLVDFFEILTTTEIETPKKSYSLLDLFIATMSQVE